MYIKRIVTAVLCDFCKLLIVNDEKDPLIAQPTELHALLDEVSLSLALRVVAVDVVLDKAVVVFATALFCGLVWHSFSLCVFV